ncbi:DUF2203 family protein [Paenibacillus albus]|uniref:DUF2203 family protein n=1 Tax=Paenibacillus albus TaxID=2495582 RepID=A0A3Q8X7B4_9BACL|nr:DUF2203 domain-containing protein [Paenibacillus albus]AZN41812.1 DUF2203 family protein [Paenibacillus albus]
MKRVEQPTFTISEANAMLPQLQEDLFKLQLLAQHFEEKYEELQILKGKRELAKPQGSTDSDPFFELESQLEFMRMEIDLGIGNFERKGVMLKMINPGLIDFPSLLNGEKILICWKQGEARISHYHGWNDGFIGRKPYPEC